MPIEMKLDTPCQDMQDFDSWQNMHYITKMLAGQKFLFHHDMNCRYLRLFMQTRQL